MAEMEEDVKGAAAAAGAQAGEGEEGVEGEQKPSHYRTMPYTVEEVANIAAFFKKRTKNPIDYTFAKDGNLETKEGAKVGKRRRAEPAGILRLKRFVPIDATEREQIEQERLAELIELDKEFEAAREELRAAWAEYATTGSMREVLLANTKVTELDMRRTAVRSAVRSITAIKNPVTSQVLFSQAREQRKLFYMNSDPFEKELYMMSQWDFTPEVEFGKYVPDEEVAKEEEDAEEEGDGIQPTEAAFRQRLRDGRIARIFYDIDSEAEANRFLSPMSAITFTFEGTEYACPIQAYESARAVELGRPELKANLLKTRAGRTIRIMMRKVEGHPRDAKGLWFRIYTAIAQQHPDFKQKLIATGTDALVYADIQAGPSGVGFAEKDSRTLDPSKWAAENALGVALETVRTRVREDSLKEVAGGGATERAITEEEQEKARVGAIINARRAARGF